MDYVAVGHITVDELDGLVRLGGGVSYGSAFAAGLGLAAKVVSRVGTDLSDELLRPLREAGVDLSGLRRACERTTRFVIRLKESSEVSGLAYRCDPIAPSDLEGVEAGVIHLAPVAREVSREVAYAAINSGSLVLLDLQGVIRTFDDGFGLDGTLAREFEGLDLVVHANLQEARAITGEDNPMNAAERLSSMFWMSSVTLGRRGAVISSPEGFVVARAPKVESLDDVGAGDVFTAALGIALWRGYSLEDAARFSVAAAAASTRRRGPVPVAREEVESLMPEVEVSWL
ncbi:MAG: PfkB family carbohydrate kinase [Candidatus Korarchaeota archaeon]|nr:PfkB family carbohydrate kinase [Candidatus Korarchaeota archaeon]